MYAAVAFDDVFVVVGGVAECASFKFWRMSYFKEYLGVVGDKVKFLGCYGMEVAKSKSVSIAKLRRVFNLSGDEDNVVVNVFVDNKPWPPTKSQSLALAKGEVLVSLMLSEHFAGFPFHDVALLVSEIVFKE